MVSESDFNPVEAELSLLACALLQPVVTEAVRLDPGEFYHPARGELWRAIGVLHSEGVTPDPATVLGKLQLPAHRAEQMAALMVECATYPAIASNADAYVATIRDRAERRRITSLVERLSQRIADETVPAADTIAEVEASLSARVMGEEVIEDAMTLDEFCDQDMGTVEWVIPGLLARDDRLVITGIEGFGKSMLMRQMAVAVAAGLHPFSLRSIPQRRVLVVDCENPKRIMAEKFATMRGIAHTRGSQTGDRLWIKRFPGGLDLASPADRLSLHRLCQVFRPDMLVIGPVYKLYLGGSNQREEDLARTVAGELDKLRAEFGFALVLEHHSPHAQPGSTKRSVRPIGSSLWLRWPEFGWGIAPAQGTDIPDRIAEVRHWRGSRDEREWPSRLAAGAPSELPWIDPDRMHRSAARAREPNPHQRRHPNRGGHQCLTT